MWGFLPEEAVFQWCAHALHNSTGRTERESESETFRRLLFVVEDVEEGENLTEENVQSSRGKWIKPALGRQGCVLP